MQKQKALVDHWDNASRCGETGGTSSAATAQDRLSARGLWLLLSGGWAIARAFDHRRVGCRPEVRCSRCPGAGHCGAGAEKRRAAPLRQRIDTARVPPLRRKKVRGSLTESATAQASARRPKRKLWAAACCAKSMGYRRRKERIASQALDVLEDNFRIDVPTTGAGRARSRVVARLRNDGSVGSPLRGAVSYGRGR